jgi:hypothetical protein
MWELSNWKLRSETASEPRGRAKPTLEYASNQRLIKAKITLSALFVVVLGVTSILSCLIPLHSVGIL